MKCNVGGLDKKLRIIAGVVIILLGTYITDTQNFSLGVVIQIVGSIIFATGIFNFCPAYKFLNINTYNESKDSCCSGSSCCDSKDD